MTSSVLQVLQLTLHLSVLCVLTRGQTCSSTGSDAQSSCSRSKQCRADHPLEEAQCLPYPVTLPVPSPLPEGITRCPMRWGEVLRCEYPMEDTNETLSFDSGDVAVSVGLKSTDYRRFAVNVSWNQPRNYTGGYEVRVKEDGYLAECYCVSDPELRGLYLDDQMIYPPFSYYAVSSTIQVEVILLSDALPQNSTTATAQVEWPSSCLDIQHNSTTCGLPVYGPPSDVVVYQYFSRSSEAILSIQWHYETSFPLPEVYYVEVYDIRDIFTFYTFVVKNSSSVLISDLEQSAQYGVRVQPYVHCSGLAHRTYSLGCGLWSRAVSPLLNHHIIGQKPSNKIRPFRMRN